MSQASFWSFNTPGLAGVTVFSSKPKKTEQPRRGVSFFFVFLNSFGALALLGWAAMLNPTLLLAGVFVLGLGFAVNAPAWASLVPQLVTDEELPSALTLGGLQLNISGILGPALAGILLSRLAAPFVFALNAAGFLLVFLAIPGDRHLGLSLLAWELTQSSARSLSYRGCDRGLRQSV